MSRKSFTIIVTALFVSIIVGVGLLHVRSSETEMERLRLRVASLETSVLRLSAHRGRVSQSPALVQPVQFQQKPTHNVLQSRTTSGKRRPVHSTVQSRITGGPRSIPKSRTGRRMQGRAPGIRPLPRASGEVPVGAVIAFKTRTCPRGWLLFHKGKGRVIVGAEPFTTRREAGGRRPFYLLSAGGRESVILNKSNMPSHNHVVALKLNLPNPGGRHEVKNFPISGTTFGTRNRRSITVPTYNSGRPNPVPVKVLQPWVALTLCEKRG